MGLSWNRHVFRAIQVELEQSSFSVEFYSLADFGGLDDGFQLRRIRRDEEAGKAARSISRASPGTEDEGCVFRHVVDVA